MFVNLGYLFAYAYSQFLNGLIVGTAGPLLPFLASHSHISSASYWYVFLARAGGAVVGAIIYKILQCYDKVSAHHKVLGITSIMFFLTLFLFQFWHNLVGTGVLMSIYEGINYCQNIAIVCSLLMVPSKEKLFFWLSMSNGSFGLGSVTAPLIVDIFQLHAYTAQAVLIFPLIIIYLFVLQTPQSKQKQRQEIQKQNVASSNEQQPQREVKYMTTFLAAILGINFFLLHGIQNTNGGWLSSYAVMAKIANKEQAALFTTTFWLTYTIARYVSGCINATVSTKLLRLAQLGVISAIFSTIFSFMGFSLLATILCSIMQGISVSGIYPLSLALPYEYGLQLTQKQISTIMIVMMVSEGIMVAPTGFLMKSVSINVFFIALFLFNLALLFNSHYIISLFKKVMPLKQEIQEKQVKEVGGQNYQDLVEVAS